MKDLTINLHVTEACNLQCSYCFAHWDKKNEIFRDQSRILHFIDFLEHQARSALGVEALTINFAGGEPSLLKHLDRAAKHCRDLNVRTSVITNGLLFDRFTDSEIAAHFDVVGVSIDSFDDHTNRLIGRVSRRDQVFDYRNMIERLCRLKSEYGVLTKVNTVVSDFNFSEVLEHEIVSAGVDRWKIFRVLPVGEIESISSDRFWTFVASNSKLSTPVVEDNDDMMRSYIMINSNGSLYQSSRIDSGIRYSYFDLNEGGLFEGLRAVGIDFSRYRRRYDGYPGFRIYEESLIRALDRQQS